MRGCAMPNRTREVWQQIFSRPFLGAFSFPRLMPWAAFFRRFAAAAGGDLFLT